MEKLKVLSVFGTRPEAIKLAPVIHALQKSRTNQTVCVTGQHRQMLDQMLDLFEIRPDHDLNIMVANQTLEDINTKVLKGFRDILLAEQPSLVLVQGDTTTAFAAALAAYYQQIPVGHVEAGLRTNNKYNPFPEEMNRRLITQIADYNFAPTELAKQHLINNGVSPQDIWVTGNTVVDALIWVLERKLPPHDPALTALDTSKQTVLVTTHRRENLGAGMDGIFAAIKRLAVENAQLQFVFPVHLNPKVRHQTEVFKGVPNVKLIEPLSYSDLAWLMNHCYFVMTDSGGIQEEAPALGKPVLVMRTTTERPEGIKAGTAQLIGVDEEDVYRAAKRLLTDDQAYQKMAKAVNPYGDGHAAERIVEAIIERAK